VNLNKIVTLSGLSSLVVVIVAYLTSFAAYYNINMVLTLILFIILYLKKDELKEGVAIYFTGALAWYQLYWGIKGVFFGTVQDVHADWFIAMLPFVAACFWLMRYLFDLDWSKLKIVGIGTMYVVATALISYLFRMETVNIPIFILLVPCLYKMLEKSVSGIGEKCISIFLAGLAWYQGYFALQSLLRWIFVVEQTYTFRYFTIGLLPFNFGLFVLLFYIFLKQKNG